MSAAPSPHVTTLESWAALDEDDSRELVDGRLEEAEVPTAIHEAVVRWLVILLDAYFRPRGGLVFGPGIKLAFALAPVGLPTSFATAQERGPKRAAS
jgi:hypothetical protein